MTRRVTKGKRIYEKAEMPVHHINSMTTKLERALPPDSGPNIRGLAEAMTGFNMRQLVKTWCGKELDLVDHVSSDPEEVTCEECQVEYGLHLLSVNT